MIPYVVLLQWPDLEKLFHPRKHGPINMDVIVRA
jgi:hypothetical protein